LIAHSPVYQSFTKEPPFFNDPPSSIQGSAKRTLHSLQNVVNDFCMRSASSIAGDNIFEKVKKRD
jgi:hypothetical protein